MIRSPSPRRTGRLLATAAVTLTAIAGVSGAAQGASHEPPSGQLTGCPEGAVCVYPDASWNWGSPTHVFFGDGAHQLFSQYGEHRVLNNQEDPGYAELCAVASGVECDNLIAPGEYTDINLTDVESIRLFSY